MARPADKLKNAKVLTTVEGEYEYGGSKFKEWLVVLDTGEKQVTGKFKKELPESVKVGASIDVVVWDNGKHGLAFSLDKPQEKSGDSGGGKGGGYTREMSQREYNLKKFDLYLKAYSVSQSYVVGHHEGTPDWDLELVKKETRVLAEDAIEFALGRAGLLKEQ